MLASMGPGSHPPSELTTLRGWVAWHADHRPEAPALVARNRAISYAVLERRTRIMAGALASRGIGASDRVLVALPNQPAAVTIALALGHIGATSVEVSRTWSAAMLREVVGIARVRHVVAWERDVPLWADVLGGSAVEHVWLVGGGTGPVGPLASHTTSWVGEDGTLEASTSLDPPHPAARMPDDAPAVILFTSGSTGRPSGVIQTVRNIDANTRAIVQYLSLTSADRAFLTLPIAYCYGRSVLQTHLFVGGSVVLENGMAFPRVAMEAMAVTGCTGFAGVPLTFEILRRQVDFSDVPRGRLRYVTQAGGTMAPDTTAWLREAIAPARLFVMYGQTEATARISYLPPERAADKTGSIGIPVPGVEVRIVDEAGIGLPRGSVGEIEVRGDNVTPGYLDDPEATAAILRDGWLRTGDLGRLDDEGFLFHQGRAKEIIKVGGHRISPIEIEQVLAGHPDVAEAAVRGMADDLMGEVPVAFIVLEPGRNPDEGVLRAYCRERMPQWMLPGRFVTLDRLPRNEAGKLLRAQLMESL